MKLIHANNCKLQPQWWKESVDLNCDRNISDDIKMNLYALYSLFDNLDRNIFRSFRKWK